MHSTDVFFNARLGSSPAKSQKYGLMTICKTPSRSVRGRSPSLAVVATMRSIDHLTGGEIAQIAYDQPPIKPFGIGFACEILTYIFTILCAIVVGLRVYVRTFKETTKQKWRINDYLAVFGFVSPAPPLVPRPSFAPSRVN